MREEQDERVGFAHGGTHDTPGGFGLAEKYRIERTKWDALARRSQQPGALVLPAELDFWAYSESSTTLRPVGRFLGSLNGKRVLEYGCGLGFLSVLLARSGARVDAFDLSAESIAVARRRAELNNVSDAITFAVAAGERLPYADEVFDVAVGKAVLHHLEPDLAQPELMRVLKPGGKAGFAEPLGMNPLLTFAREYLPYPRKKPRGADRPLDYEDIRTWGRNFGKFSYQELQLLAMLERALGTGTKFPALHRLDMRLLARLPALRRYCRYVVLLMKKAEKYDESDGATRPGRSEVGPAHPRVPRRSGFN